MRGVFDDEDIQPVQQRHETELTLSATVLVGLLIGLVLICGACFGAGYLLGHHQSQATPATAQNDSSLPAAAPQAVGRQKPSATAQTAAAAEAQASTKDDDSPAGTPNAVASSMTHPLATATSPQVHAALPQALGTSPPQSPSLRVSPALNPGAFMVQIAAVSHNEDAEVLVNALLKRGYVVSARRDAGDGLIHVRVGPFNSRDEADKWRQKLLNDGYNAMVQP